MVITGFSRPVNVLQINGRCRSNHGLSVECARAQAVSEHPCLPAAVCLARWARRSRCPNSARFVDRTSRYISDSASSADLQTGSPKTRDLLQASATLESPIPQIGGPTSKHNLKQSGMLATRE